MSTIMIRMHTHSFHRLNYAIDKYGCWKRWTELHWICIRHFCEPLSEIRIERTGQLHCDSFMPIVMLNQMRFRFVDVAKKKVAKEKAKNKTEKIAVIETENAVDRPRVT